MWKGVDYAIIKSKAWTLGCIYDVSKEHYVYGRQSFKVVLSNTGYALGSDYLSKEDCILMGFTDSIQDGDLIWILQGASNPTVVRLCDDHFTVILPAMPRKDAQAKPFEKTVEHNRQYPSDDVVFTWELPHIQETTSTRPAKLAEKVSSSNYHESRIETQSRWRHIEFAMLDIYSNARRDRAYAIDAIKNLMTLGCPECVPLGKIAIAAAGDEGRNGLFILVFLFRHFGDNYHVSDVMVQAAAANTGYCGPAIMMLLFQGYGEKLPITDETFQTAAANTGRYSRDIMNILLENRGEKLAISDETVQAAAANPSYGPEIIQVLFKNRGKKLTVSDQVVQAAAANPEHGHKIMQILSEES
ncbi:unnamed protein product [Penicillium salamii]|uniref:Uncharacterized protein n=1 Tax=Penicillium salamii TaxID=1612424 RepID=A0A9W4JJT7_9EURO|nr:unnamed protein product [Penicillium salamii]CAG8390348.1 unnamed protein product [Penicillium salamii]CAG8391451.1 unnamed protein product [Penicillium salamii]CAG8403885.1 unnamed protein product [Penicillium salamii]